jgi:hypothetical protein
MAKIVLISPILVTLMMEVLGSSDTLVLTRATCHNIPEDSILDTLIALVIPDISTLNKSKKNLILDLTLT